MGVMSRVNVTCSLAWPAAGAAAAMVTIEKLTSPRHIIGITLSVLGC
jgi:hypothetical protein